MNVLLVNGSPHEKGCTYAALMEMAAQFEKRGVDAELFWIGNGPVRGCIDCKSCWGKGRCVFDDDCVNRLIEKIAACDGLVIGTPVYFGGIAGGLKCVLDRVFYDAKRLFSGKPAISPSPPCRWPPPSTGTASTGTPRRRSGPTWRGCRPCA